MGDVAMLQVALKRLQARLPSASFDVITRDPLLLSKHIESENIHAIPADGNLHFHLPFNLIGGLRRIFRSRETAINIERLLFLTAPQQAIRRVLRRRKQRQVKTDELETFVTALLQADAVICTGGGYLTDDFGDHAERALLTAAIAAKLGKHVSFLGQGIGPIRNRSLNKLARRSLRLASSIGIRENGASLDILRNYGVRQDRVWVTGDDAIEAAYDSRPDTMGKGLGINLRLSHYAGITPEWRCHFLTSLTKQASMLGVECVSVPISWHEGEADDRVVSSIMPESKIALVHTPAASINVAGKCRLVVTGSYHAGVFALSQGVSVIGVYASNYYADKFQGLMRQFGNGCSGFDLRSTSPKSGALEAAVTAAWERADSNREHLLKIASAQIAVGNAYYDSVANGIINSIGRN